MGFQSRTTANMGGERRQNRGNAKRGKGGKEVHLERDGSGESMQSKRKEHRGEKEGNLNIGVVTDQRG